MDALFRTFPVVMEALSWSSFAGETRMQSFCICRPDGIVFRAFFSRNESSDPPFRSLDGDGSVAVTVTGGVVVVIVDVAVVDVVIAVSKIVVAVVVGNEGVAVTSPSISLTSTFRAGVNTPILGPAMETRG